MFKRKLKSILKCVQNFSTDKDEVLAEAVSARLQKSLDSYNDQVTKSLRYLSDKNSIRMMKKLNRG